MSRMYCITLLYNLFRQQTATLDLLYLRNEIRPSNGDLVEKRISDQIYFKEILIVTRKLFFTKCQHSIRRNGREDKCSLYDSYEKIERSFPASALFHLKY